MPLFVNVPLVSVPGRCPSIRLACQYARLERGVMLIWIDAERGFVVLRYSESILPATVLAVEWD